MRSFARLAVAFIMVIAVAIPVFAGLDDSWDWPNDPATGKPRRKIRIKYGFPAGTKLGDQELKDIMDRAVANWNGVKDKTGWEFEVVGASDEADVEVLTEDHDSDGGAFVEWKVDKDGRVKAGTCKMKFDPTPPGYGWDEAGKNKDDTKNPVSCAKHELSHLLRLDHQGGKRSVSLKLKDPQGKDTKDDDVTTVSDDDIAEAKKTSTLAIKKAKEDAAHINGCMLAVPAFAGEMPAYPTTPDITLLAPPQAFLSPASVSLMRRNLNSMPDPFLRDSPARGRIIKGLEIVVVGLEGMPPRVNPDWLTATILVPYEDGTLGYDHLMEHGDPDYGEAEEQSIYPVLWDPRAGMWLPIEPRSLGGSFFRNTAANHVQIELPATLLNAFVMPEDPLESRLIIGLAALKSPVGDALMVVPDPVLGGVDTPVAIIHTAVPAPPGGLLFTLTSPDPNVQLPPDPVLLPEGSVRVEVPFQVLPPSQPQRSLVEASAPGITLSSFFDVFTSLGADLMPASGRVGETIPIQAVLRRTSDGLALPGRPILFEVVGLPAVQRFTNGSGVAEWLYQIPEGDGAGLRITTGTFLGDWPQYPGAHGFGWLEVLPAPTRVSTLDRTATVGELVVFRGYLRRLTDMVWLSGRVVDFSVDGNYIGSGTTNASGRADLNWIVPPGPATRAIGAAFAGDAAHEPSTGSATLTAVVWTTKMVGFDRTVRIGGRTELKTRLLRSDNTPLFSKQVNFYVDGTFVISRPTDTQGYAKYPYYDVPDGAGAGTRTIRSEWPGNGGYVASSVNATLTVTKALPYIWVYPRSVPQGGIYKLYCYFRRLYDYEKQADKTLAFSIDGTWIADVVTDSGGIARYNYNTSGLSIGDHTARCTFAGDPWVDAGYGEGRLTIY